MLAHFYGNETKMHLMHENLISINFLHGNFNIKITQFGTRHC